MLSRKQSQFYSSYCGSSEKVITPAFQASIASSNLVSRTKSHTFYPLKLVGQSMAWLSHARWTTILKSMKDCQQAVCLAPSWLTHTCQCSRHELTDGKQPSHVNAKQKAESTGVFLSTLLLLRVFVWTAPRRWEWRNTGLFFVGNFVECLNIYRIFLFEYMCITFCSNSGEEREITGQFEYMSYYLLLKLEPLGHAAPCSLNICRITFYLNFCREVIWSYWFECMSHYLLLKLFADDTHAGGVWMYVALPFAQTFNGLTRWNSCLNVCRITF